MKVRISSRRLFALGFVVLAAANIFVLSGVAYNRTGAPETQIVLTERELRLPSRIHEENSALALRLGWRALGKNEDDSHYPDWRTPGWLNAEKLTALGFDMNRYRGSDHNGNNYPEPIPKEVFIVLEIDGQPYRKALERAENALRKEESLFRLSPGDKRLRENFESAQKRLRRERMAETRLFAVDAGLDPIRLRKQYKDRTRFIITKGLVRPGYRRAQEKKEVFGSVSRLSVANIYVPLEYRQMFDSLLSQHKSRKNEFGPPRYEVELAYGRRFEPWIVSVKPVADRRE